MPQPSQQEIRSLRDFTHYIEDALAATGRPLWFRGCGRSSYHLLPSLYRHPRVSNLEALLDMERRLIIRFKQRSLPFLTKTYGDDWDCLFLMQHSGVPTRLLDWTENPYVALYFALASAPFSITTDGIEYSEPSAVWILDPSEWNRQALHYIGYKGGILSPGDQVLRGYEPGIQADLINSDPVALYGTHNSPRIVAQRGVFLMFGRNVSPAECVYEKGGYPGGSLQKLVIPPEVIPQLLQSLASVGVTDSTVFPDLDGLARELKRHFGYPVYV